MRERILFVMEFEDIEGDAPPVVRARRFVKSAGRYWGGKCTYLRQLPDTDTPDFTNQFSQPPGMIEPTEKAS